MKGRVLQTYNAERRSSCFFSFVYVCVLLLHVRCLVVHLCWNVCECMWCSCEMCVCVWYMYVCVSVCVQYAYKVYCVV